MIRISFSRNLFMCYNIRLSLEFVTCIFKSSKKFLMLKFLDFITVAVKTRFHKGRIAIFHKIIALIV